jgi:phytoene dehydrogenase-like protein
MPHTALVIGSGPNGLAAAIALAQAGLHVTVHEAASEAGGATRSGELTLPGFLHDLGSAVHPLAVSSPFFRSLELGKHGLQWIWPTAELAHPLDDGSAILVERSVDSTAGQLGQDAAAYRALFQPLVRNWFLLADEVLRPLGIPRHPLLLAEFGRHAYLSAGALAHKLFKTPRAKALFAGMAAHSTLPMDAAFSAAFGLILGASAHAVGWPVPQGGARSIARALEAVLAALGGRIITNLRVETLGDSGVTMCDITPRQFLALAQGRLKAGYRRKLEAYRYGPGVFKVDWALRQAIPWKAPECGRSATVHLGGSYEEIALSEAQVNRGQMPARPFVILAQPSLFDAARAPAAHHTAWAYCHVPNGYAGPAVEEIENQMERFAPGFRQTVLGRATHSAPQMELWNANLVGGDINGGAVDFRQLLLRPTPARYRTSLPGVYLCSSSTPPGGGVHGMCGYWAARWALRDLRSRPWWR